MKDAIKINKADNVAVALRELKAGESFFGATLDTDVPMGHKIAITEIGLGQDVIKYGLPIGHATKDIPRGAWVHTHNMATGLSGELSYTYEPSTTELPKREPTTFLGYRREGGRVGIRNEIWIIPTVGCVNDVAKRLAKEGEALVSARGRLGIHAPLRLLADGRRPRNDEEAFSLFSPPPERGGGAHSNSRL